MNEFLLPEKGTIFLQREVLSSEPTIIFFEDMLVFRGVKDGFPLVAYDLPHGTHSPVETFRGLGATFRPSIAQHCHLVHQKS